jgi:hypothetical protein
MATTTAPKVFKKAIVFKTKTAANAAMRKAKRWARANPDKINKGAGSQVFSCWVRHLIETAE